jgi:hypothetical protein
MQKIHLSGIDLKTSNQQTIQNHAFKNNVAESSARKQKQKADRVI